MTERILDKIDRLGAEAGILVMTTEIRRFALLIRADMLKTMPMPTGMDDQDTPADIAEDIRARSKT